ncbi:hypothetical protein DFH28DRAFT_1129777 [Melampsora americana]|nr:hypothetical protein DFH28DRAFT_1129777 [Melampsora americana]
MTSTSLNLIKSTSTHSILTSISNDHHPQSTSNHRTSIDSLHQPINSITNTLQKDVINYHPIQISNLPLDQTGLGHALQDAIRQQDCSFPSRTMLSRTTQHTGSQYAINQTLDQLTGSDEQVFIS